ncbi:MAG: hypothetical protein ACR2PX_16065 [Endozoicomonas sp.]|uniref:hypothetical protein n=1 Tax=Endozoicomonas sp. TaxID=1892382 RepID=UPI003D9B403E
MQSMVRLPFLLAIFLLLSIESIAVSSHEDSIPILKPTVMPEAQQLFNKLLDKEASSFQGIFETNSNSNKNTDNAVVLRLPAMSMINAMAYVQNELHTHNKGRELAQSYVLECDQTTHECEMQIHFSEKDLPDEPVVAIYQFKVLTEFGPVTTETVENLTSKPEGNNSQEKEQSEPFCERDYPCPTPSSSYIPRPSPTVDGSMSSETFPALSESDLPALEPNWYEKLSIYQNIHTSDTLVLRNNIIYYTGKSLPLLLDLLNSLLFYAGTINTSYGYYSHFANTQVLAEILALGDSLPRVINDHNLVLVTPQADATAYSLAAAIYVTYKYYWNDLVLNKKKMSQADVRVFFAWKLFANIATKALSELGEYRLFADESDPEIRKMKASVFTSLVTAMPYGAKLVVSVLTGNNYANHLLKAIPADHLLSCSISTNGSCIQLFFHRLLGEADMTMKPAIGTEPAMKVQSGLSYLPSAITQATIGQVCSRVGLTVVGRHYTKGAGYALVDGVDKYMIAQGSSDLTRYTVLTGGALMMSAANYQYSKAFATGFSSRYAKYMMMYAATVIGTVIEFYFHTTILR